MTEPSSPTGVETPTRVAVVVADEQTEQAIDANRWGQLAARVLETEQCVGELTLTFVGRDEIAAMNAEYMGKNGPTDVLSFPLDDAPDDVVAGPVLLGDVVVCPGVAADQAATHAGTLDDELALLTVHGVLHVLGHDHTEIDDTARMRARERDLLEQHHWHGPVPSGFRFDHPEDES